MRGRGGSAQGADEEDRVCTGWGYAQGAVRWREEERGGGGGRRGRWGWRERDGEGQRDGGLQGRRGRAVMGVAVMRSGERREEEK
ncbi:hypothetical protein MRB53_031973 [Persea americana]|uniref:Uncharacterized protein n=1 Tax=Persea americana TaxID=3435 RepID=A0ACC2KR15_PERAE|nr:hypothetical protein MRB53_031973 [Persea americana]